MAVDPCCPLCGADAGVRGGQVSGPPDPGLASVLAREGIDPEALCPDCARGDPPSPCIGLCTLDAARTACTGCHRTLDEIVGWSDAGPATKATTLLRLGAGRSSER